MPAGVMELEKQLATLMEREEQPVELAKKPAWAMKLEVQQVELVGRQVELLETRPEVTEEGLP